MDSSYSVFPTINGSLMDKSPIVNPHACVGRSESACWMLWIWPAGLNFCYKKHIAGLCSSNLAETIRYSIFTAGFAVMINNRIRIWIWVRRSVSTRSLTWWVFWLKQSLKNSSKRCHLRFSEQLPHTNNHPSKTGDLVICILSKVPFVMLRIWFWWHPVIAKEMSRTS